MADEKYEPTGHDTIYVPENISAHLQGNYNDKTAAKEGVSKTTIAPGGLEVQVDNAIVTIPAAEQKDANKTDVKYEPIGFHPCYAILPE